jgi:FlaA1/EpsC-like NDP-sugar epimerase
MEVIIALPRRAKRLIAVALDVVTCVVAVFLAYYLRLDEWRLPSGNEWLSYAVAVLLTPPILAYFEVYTAIHRFASWGTYGRLFRGCIVFAIAQILIFIGVSFRDVPRSIAIIQPTIFALGAVLWRFLLRMALDPAFRSALLKGDDDKRILIYGAGAAGRQLAAALDVTSGVRVIGYVEDNPNLAGNAINGIRVYSAAVLADLLQELRIDDLLIALPSASRARRRQILESVRPSRVGVRLLPGIDQLAAGKVTVSDLREPEIEDLLGRDPISPSAELMAAPAKGRVVMVTGAGGSIGAELCRQLIAQGPQALVLVDTSEFNLYGINRELEGMNAGKDNAPTLHPLLLSVQNEAALRSAMERFRPHTVFHAAAYKHVPLVEANICEAVANNVLGTCNCARAARDAGVERFILISTDKAVRPTNVMGASKRVAEELLQALDAEGSTIFAMVRFGNVMGSSGSVIPLFRSQLRGGGPLTITHPEVTRFFMTIPEASQLVIQAGAMAEGGEVFLLEMGEPVKIMDLAVRMVELSGLKVQSEQDPHGDIEIRIIGLRPGEKLYEELLIGEDADATEHPRILKAREGRLEPRALYDIVEQFPAAIASGDTAAVIALLKQAVPGFDHQPHGQVSA